MPGVQQEDDDNVKTEKLKAALWYAVGQTVDSITLKEDLNATPHFIGGLTEMIWAQIDSVAHDLEAFAKHAGRSTINSKDVVLLGRQTRDLEKMLKDEASTVQQAEKNGR